MCEIEDSPRQCSCICRWRKLVTIRRTYGFSNSGNIGSDHRQAARHALQQAFLAPFRFRAAASEVRRCQESGDVVDAPEKSDALSKAEFACEGFHAVRFRMQPAGEEKNSRI